MTNKHTKSIHYQTVFRWFSKIFITISLSFSIALIPLFASMRSTFSDLHAEKIKQFLHSGSQQISSTVSGMINVSASLREDIRFNQLRYKEVDYDNISITTQRQMQDALNDLTSSLEAITNIVLLADQQAVITEDSIFFNTQPEYYSNFFQVDDMTYDEWVNILADTGTGFTPVYHIKTYVSEYDAIIFVTPWSGSSYLYTCLNVKTLKQFVLEESLIKNCYYTVSLTDDTVLYSDLPENAPKCQTFTEQCTTGHLKLSVHIPNDIFYKSMSSFYLFFSVYVIACLTLWISVSILGSRHATKPVMNIIDILEQSKNIKSTETISGFDYITGSIKNAEQNLETYRLTLSTQQKILQTRFFEKAINGQLVSKADIQDFQTYFPNFPDSFRMLLVKIWSYTNGASSTLYQEPLLLLQSFLEQELVELYQHQINDTELLLVLSEDNYEQSSHTLNFIINNINQEEPTYHAFCMSSSVYYSLNDLPTAYQQLRTVDGASLSDFQTQICTVTDSVRTEETKIPVTMIDLMTLYTAITSGNPEVSLNRLASYSAELSTQENVSFTKPVFEMIKSMLTYIKIDYLQLLLEQHIPSYQSGKTLYDQLAEVVESFCNLINGHNNVDKDSFAQELFSYIDAHYTDSNICLTSLKTHFKCSESTIRKTFKRVTDIPIARYIEQKRMLLANNLLAQNEKSVTEIAHECGYSLPHSFYKAYKRVYGHAPTLPNSNSRGDNDENELL